MRSVASALLAFLALAVSVSAQVPPPPPPPAPSGIVRDSQTQKTGTARISGRVTSAETGTPLRRAQVRAMAPELREGRTVSTDADGRWEMKEMPAGRYSITFSKGGYVSLAYGQRRPFEQGKPVDVAEAQVVAKLDVGLPKGSVITGRIVDEFGEAVAGARVAVMRYRFIGGQRRLTTNFVAGGTDTTDDIGQYRLHGLTPGDYYVSATFGTTFSFEKSDDRTGYAATFFPGTAMASEAQRVTIAEGQEASGVSFALAPIRVARVSGTATSSDGKALANGMIMLTSPTLQTGSPLAGTSVIRPDGTFTISNVAPGDYTLQTQSAADLEALASSGSTNSMRMAETALMAVTVTGTDISGIQLVTAPTATARGRIVFESGVPTDARPASVNVMAISTSTEVIMLGGGSGRVADDWTFTLRGVSGKRIIRANPPPGWWLSTVTFNGTDVTDAGLEFKPGEEVSGLEITLTRKMATMSGTVQTAKSQPATDYVVVAFVADSAKWVPPTRFVRTARPDQSGKFLLAGLPAGDYLVAALDYLEPGDESDPEALERLRAQATRIDVGSGESKVVSLKLK
jgi:5-hydroxyisourate hydrolase-like protein (transthyretin family)